MRITGRNFMAWYDDWAKDPDSDGLYWENDNSVATLHGEKGEWLLDPDRIYVLDELGEIDDPRPGAPRIDTEATVGAWLTGTVRHVVLVSGLDLDPGMHAVTTPLGVGSVTVADASRPAGQLTGAEVAHLMTTAFPDDQTFEDDEPLQMPDGRWRIDLSALYSLDDLGEIEGPLPASVIVANYLTSRTEIPVVVDVPREVAARQDMGGTILQAPAGRIIAPQARPSTPTPSP
jgi:hypothetical protein